MKRAVRPAEPEQKQGDESDEIVRLRARLETLIGSDPLGALELSAQVEALGRTSAAAAAAAACQQGASWSEVGDAFGISKQAAHQRFARHVKAARRR